MESIYYEKYLKYKTKYIDMLENIKGGARPVQGKIPNFYYLSILGVENSTVVKNKYNPFIFEHGSSRTTKYNSTLLKIGNKIKLYTFINPTGSYI